MNFFGVGPAEVVVILIVALIFVGPERLPRLAADIARTIREIRRYTGSIAAEFTEVLQDFERDTAEDRSQWREIGEGLTEATKSVAEALRGARDDLQAGAAPPAPPAASPAAANGAAEPVWRDIAEPAPNGAAPAAAPEEQR
jgi:sec-independent protein translocase protein TatB